MDQGEKSPNKPPSGSSNHANSSSRNLFDPANLLGSPSFSGVAVSAASQFNPMLHMPSSAFSMLGRPPGFPLVPPFGGLGVMGNPLAAMPHLSPTAGGAEWWRAASEHARLMAGAEYYGGLGGLPPYGLPDGAASLEALYHQAQADKSLAANGLLGFPMFPPLFPLPTTGLPCVTSTTVTTTTSQAKISSPKAISSSSSRSATVTRPSSSSSSKAPPSPKHTPTKVSSESLSSRQRRPPESHSSERGENKMAPQTSHSHGSHSKGAPLHSPNQKDRERRPSRGETPGERERRSSHGEIPGERERRSSHGEIPGLFNSHGLPHDLRKGHEGSPRVKHHDPLSIGALLGSPSHDVLARPPSPTKTAAYALGALKSLAEQAEAQQHKAETSRHSKAETSHHAMDTSHHTVETSHRGLEMSHHTRDKSQHTREAPHHGRDMSHPALDMSHTPTKDTSHSTLPQDLSVSSLTKKPADDRRDKGGNRSRGQQEGARPHPDGKERAVDGKHNGLPAPMPTAGLPTSMPTAVIRETPKAEHSEEREPGERVPPSRDKVMENGTLPKSSEAESDSEQSSGSSISSPDSGSAYDSEDERPLKQLSNSPQKMPMEVGSPTHQAHTETSSVTRTPERAERPEHPAMQSSLFSHLGGLQPLPSSPGSAISPTHPRSLLKLDPAHSAFNMVPSRPLGGRGRRGGRGRGGRGRGRGRGRQETVSKILSDKEMEKVALHEQDQRRKQLELKQRLEAELKKQQLQLKLAKKAAAMQRERTDSNSKDSDSPLPFLKERSKLAQALMGHMPFGPGSEQVPSSSAQEAGLVAENGQISEAQATSDSADSDSGSDEGSDSDSRSEMADTEGGDNYGTPEKRSADEDGVNSDVPRKKRRTVVDETEIRIPLEHGWRRETRIRTVGMRGIVGEVYYYAPCGKRLKTFPEVVRYLQKNNITDLTRDNFTFSTKFPVGEFLEARHGEGDNGFVLLTEQEVLDRLMTAQLRKSKQRERAELKRARKQEALELARRINEEKHKRHMARKVAELKLRRKLERQQEREQARRAKQLQALEMKKLKEREKVLRHQEKLRKQEQLRLEREMRAQQILEARRRRKEQLQSLRYGEAVRKAKEREMKRQQAFMLKEQERERRRQHMLLVKALEARKKQEERERLKEEKKNEKILIRERKMEQRRFELEMARELKKPVEDMKLRDTKALPVLKRLPGVRLSGEAFANCLMVVEFMHTYGSSMDFEPSALPTMDMLQRGLLGEGESISEMLAFTIQMLRFAVHDPGVPNPKEALTKLGQKLENVDLNDTNMSEVLRIFIRARNGRDDEMSDWLVNHPFQALNPMQKAAILGFLCNELLGSKTVSGEVDNCIERINNLRRDKWIVEGKLRKLRMAQAKLLGRGNKSGCATPSHCDEESSIGPCTPRQSKKDSDDEEEESEGESGNEQAESEEEEQGLTLEEIEKKMDKLNKQQGTFRGKVFETANKLRGINFGQDRYKRQYWALPHCGAILVEGLETAVEPDERREEEERLAQAKVKPEVKPEVKTEAKSEVKPKEEEAPDIKAKLPELPAVATRLHGQNRMEVKKEEPEEKRKCLKHEQITPVLEKVGETHISSSHKHDLQDSRSCQGHDLQDARSGQSQPEVSASDTNKPHVDSNDITQNKATSSATTTPHCVPSVTDSLSLPHKVAALSNGLHPVNQKGERGYTPLSIPSGMVPKPHKEYTPLTIPSMGSKAAHPRDHAQSSSCPEQPERSTPSKHNSTEREPATSGPGLPGCTRPSRGCATPGARGTTSSAGCATSSMSLCATPSLSLSVNGSLSSIAGTSADVCTTTTSSQKTASVTPVKSEVQSSFMSIDSLLGTSSSQTAGTHVYRGTSSQPTSSPAQAFSSASILSSTSFASMAVSLATAQGTWFSILPKPACDETSITRSHSSPGGATQQQGSHLAPVTYSPLQPVPGQVYAAVPLQSTPVHSTPLVLSPSFTPQGTPSSPFTALLNASGISTPCSISNASFSFQSPAAADQPLQYDEPQPIPLEMQRSWWHLREEDEVKEMLKSLHPRGIRERNLQRTLQKYFDYACQAAGTCKEEVMNIEDCEESQHFQETLLDPPASSGQQEGVWSPEVAHQVEQFILDEIQNMEDRMYHASLQVKGWKLPTKITEDENIELVPRHVRATGNQKYTFDAAKERLLELEKNVERRYLKPPLNKNKQIDIMTITADPPPSPPPDEDDRPLQREDLPSGLLSWRQAVVTATNPAQLALCLMQLDASVAWEKSIMKVKCQICQKDDNEAELLLCDGCDKGYHTYCFRPKMENIPDGDWYCYECVSKATGVPCCVVCGLRDGKMVECEHCPRAFHTDCLDPPLPRAPKKWFCVNCISEKGKKSKSKKKKEVERERKESESSRTETPPATPSEKGRSTPSKSTPTEKSSKKEGAKKEKSKEQKEKEKEAREKQKKEEKEKEKEREKEKEKEASPMKKEEDMALCRKLLEDLEKHKDGWPFLLPVNTKQFPTYRRVIKTPMDFTTMRNKLRDSVYKTKEEFATDAFLVFDNCETFNEDDSEVGQSGHNLRKYFKRKFREAFS